MWRRVIVHSDINHCYAQIEEMKFPELRHVPMVVGGREEARHGIILAKNDLAKTYNIKTGESLREAKAKCPNLLIIHPNYDDYLYYTEKVKDIYREYTDRVESMGLDEAWFDLTGSQRLFGGDPIKIAREIQERIYKELGLTVSMGVSFNKIFAKLGSDMDKQMGLTIIDEQNYRDIVHPLPVGELFFVGRATEQKLKLRNVHTIGDLANSKKEWLMSFLGKNGEMIWYFANGLDVSEVQYQDHKRAPKSVGNGITAVRDIKTYNDAKMVFQVLVESVASRLKEENLKAKTICIHMRDTDLQIFSRQCHMEYATNVAQVMMQYVLRLVRDNCESNSHGLFYQSYRSVTVTATKLIDDQPVMQMNLFEDVTTIIEEKRIDEAMDAIRNKFGHDKVKRCVVELDTKLTDFCPKEDHVIHPEGWFKT